MEISYNSSPLTEEMVNASERPKNVESLGQVFTPDIVVRFMMGGCINGGRVLEPSCGDGAFLKYFSDAVGIELDRHHLPLNALNIDFFSYPISEKFDTIIGNPPYVRYQDIPAETKSHLSATLFDGRSNLYLFFIEKAIRHLQHRGELIFITPRDFLKATSAVKLNRWLYERGTITHSIELGDTRIFPDAVPNCLIWRFELGNFSRKTYCASLDSGRPLSQLSESWDLNWEEKNFVECGGHLLFTKASSSLRLSDIASVKVGAVSGADDLYVDPANGTRDFVCSSTAKTGETRRMIWSPEKPHPALKPHRERLIQRLIRRFDETNWWKWGRGYHLSNEPRLYVNSKTRNETPFFRHNCVHYDGSVLAIFPKNLAIDLDQFCKALNEVDWRELGFVCDGRFIFSQRSLENAPLPTSFLQFK